jgi:hypothetical protein
MYIHRNLIARAVLRTRILDPVLFLPLVPGSGYGTRILDGKNPYPGELRISFFGLKRLEFIDADPDPGFCQPWIRDGKNRNPGSGLNIPDPQHWQRDTKLSIYC